MTLHYKITHTTTYTYSSPVSVCHNLLILTPREGGRIACPSHRLMIRPTPVTTVRRTDYFGNYVHAFAIEEQHKSLSVTATSRVAVSEMPPLVDDPGPAWEKVCEGIRCQTDANWQTATQFRFNSPRVAATPEFGAYGAGSFPPGRPIVEGARDLTRRIHQDFAYDSGATNVNTPTSEAFTKRRGVCQDFAHIQIACLRALGIPCRYISGYLRTLPPPGQTKLVGADQSHAWVAVYCGEKLGWLELDPTNDCISGTDHISIAWGRDYSDVVPFRGAFTGGGDHILAVSVDVRELEPAPV